MVQESDQKNTVTAPQTDEKKSDYHYLNSQFGALNPLYDSRVADTPGGVGDLSYNFIDHAKRVIERDLSSEILENTGDYLGVVLRIETDPNQLTAVETNWLTRVQKQNCTEPAAPLLAMRVRIPELHAHLPIPKTLPTSADASGQLGEGFVQVDLEKIIGGATELAGAGLSDASIINMYPVFGCTDTATSAFVPQPGELVWVNFVDKVTQTGGIYIKPLNLEKATINSAALAGNPLAAFMVGGASSLPMQEVGGAIGAVSPEGVPLADGIPGSYPLTDPNRTVGDYAGSTMCFYGAKAGTSGLGKPKKRNRKIDMIVIHDGGNMVDGIWGVLNMSRWTKNHAGTHYFIDHDGQIFQIQDEARLIYHAGAPTADVKNGKAIPNMNNRSIGIDLMRGKPGRTFRYKTKVPKADIMKSPSYEKNLAAGLDIGAPPWSTYGGSKNFRKGPPWGYTSELLGFRSPYSKEQMQSLKLLLQDICSRYNLPYDETTIVGHGAVNVGSKAHHDPVYPFHWDELGLQNVNGPEEGNVYKLTTPPNQQSTEPAEAEVAEGALSEEEASALMDAEEFPDNEKAQVAQGMETNYPSLKKDTGNSYSSKGGFFLSPRTTISGLSRKLYESDGKETNLNSKILNRGVYRVETDISYVRSANVKIKPHNWDQKKSISSLRTNRVRVYSYGDLQQYSDNLVNVPGVRGSKDQKLHKLAAKRLEALNYSWLQYIKDYTEPELKLNNISGIFRISRGYIRHKFRDNYEYYLEKMEKKYGVDSENSYDDFHSPYETGLVFDIGNNGFKADDTSMSNTNMNYYFNLVSWQWLCENAYLYGIYPNGVSPWTWEVQVPRKNWFSGDEFVFEPNTLREKKKRGTSTYGVYVIEESVATGNRTSDEKFANEIFS